MINHGYALMHRFREVQSFCRMNDFKSRHQFFGKFFHQRDKMLTILTCIAIDSNERLNLRGENLRDLLHRHVLASIASRLLRQRA